MLATQRFDSYPVLPNMFMLSYAEHYRNKVLPLRKKTLAKYLIPKIHNSLSNAVHISIHEVQSSS